jgi:uncharacterized membrane protein (Fun14 family)
MGGENDSDPVSSAMSAFQPILTQLGFSGVMGMCSGYAAKKIGKVVESLYKWL